MPEQQKQDATEHMTSLLGDPVYDDEYITAFRVPEVAVSDDVFLIAEGENWESREEKETIDGIVWRWTTGQESNLYVYGQSETPYRIKFNIRSIQDPRHIKLLINDETIGEMIVNESRSFLSPPFSLPLEQNKVTLQVQEECVENEEDSSCRNLQISEVELLPAQAIKSQMEELTCSFGETIKLLGYDLPNTKLAPGENLEFTLYWQALEPIDQSYTVFTHLLNDNQLLAQQDNLPVVGTHPTDWWMPGEIVTDSYSILLPEDIQSQDSASLVVGLYSLASGERVPVNNSCVSAAEDFVMLSTIEITE